MHQSQPSDIPAGQTRGHKPGLRKPGTPETRKARPPLGLSLQTWFSLVLALGVMIGGFFLPVLGLAVPVLLVLALAGNFRRKRWFCHTACPRGKILSRVVSRWSSYRQMPAALNSDGVRMAGCAFLMVCAVGQTLRLWPELEVLGGFFWLVCVVTFVLALVMGLVFKPRSWCAVCPLGTLQSAASPARKEA